MTDASSKKILPLQSFRLQNFKAVRDSGIIEFTPLTVFIGNNGSGKSSLIEGLEMYQAIVANGLDKAMQRWLGMEYIRNRIVVKETKQRAEDIADTKTDVEDAADDLPADENFKEFDLISGDVFSNLPELETVEDENIPMTDEDLEDGFRQSIPNAITFYFKTNIPMKALSKNIEELFWKQYFFNMAVNLLPNEDKYYIQMEEGGNETFVFNRDALGRIRELKDSDEKSHADALYSNDVSAAPQDVIKFVGEWQFVSLNPDVMGNAVQQGRTGSSVRLAKNGENIAGYLHHIRELNQSAFDNIVQKMQEILTYASDIRPVFATELARSVYLKLIEGGTELPGWLLSSGSLRVLALLAVLCHPSPPPLIVIEEIESGLDPRTIDLIVEEIRNVLASGKTQIIITTHSPYLLDLLELSQIVVVERIDGQPIFKRPVNIKGLQEWAVAYNQNPGQLYINGRLHYISHLIAQGEGPHIDFKIAAFWNREKRPEAGKDPAMMASIIEEVAGFLNSRDGGVILIGVDCRERLSSRNYSSLKNSRGKHNKDGLTKQEWVRMTQPHSAVSRRMDSSS